MASVRQNKLILVTLLVLLINFTSGQRGMAKPAVAVVVAAAVVEPVPMAPTVPTTAATTAPPATIGTITAPAATTAATTAPAATIGTTTAPAATIGTTTAPAAAPSVNPNAPSSSVSLDGFTITGEPSLGDETPTGYTFWGVKFGNAERFQDAVVNSDHSYLANQSRNKKGPMCMQTPKSIPWTSTGNEDFGEDCLYLDIYVPPPTPGTVSNASYSNKLKPVFLWAWGGQMISSGRGIPGAGANLAKALKTIVVIPQFRVGAFGFLSTGDGASAGNFGLSDIKAAFNFVYENIEKFGGDKGRITVSGQSDGAALVSAMLLDKEIASRVFGAVTMSGSILSPWAIDEQPLDKAVALANTAGCPSTPTSALVSCLKKISGKDLQVFAEKMYSASEQAPGVPVWTMVVDSNHILYDPVWILEDHNRKGLIGGFVHQYNKQDASVVALRAFGPYITGPGKPTLAFLKAKAIPLVIQQATLCKNLSSATIDLVAKTYGMTPEADELTLRNALFELTTDVNHGLPSVKEAMLYSQTDATKFGNSISVLAYDADVSSKSPLTNFVSGGGVYHTCDVGYLFAGSMNPLLVGLTDAEVTKVFRQQFNSIFVRGYGLGESFDESQQNFIELGQDKKWHKQKFGRTVELVKFWDKLKELRCAAPPADACGPGLAPIAA